MERAAAPLRVAIYDLDKTITRRATYTGFLMHMAWHRAPWRLLLSPLIGWGLVAYALRQWDRAKLKTFNQRLFLGRPHHLDAGFAKQIHRFADRTVAGNIHFDALARIAADRADGCVLVLATASYGLYVNAIAERLGFDHVIATNLALSAGGRWLTQIIEGNCYGDTKLMLVQSWFAAQGITRGNVHVRAYSDHASDAPLLAFADTGYAVNPHRALRELATERGWDVLTWR